MATPVFCCGTECGMDAHWTKTGSPTVITTGPLSGLRSVECARDGSGTDEPHGTTIATFSGAGKLVLGGWFKFTTTTNGNSAFFGIMLGAFFAGVRCTTSGVVRAIIGSTVSAQAAAVNNDKFFVSLIIDTSADPWTVEAIINGTTMTVSLARAADTSARSVKAGWPNDGPTVGTVVWDDIIVSETEADYPIAAASIFGFVPSSDGTHNIAGTGDFQRGDTGTDILNATTTAYQLIDDVPMPSGAVNEADCWRAVAPPNSTDYPEAVFALISGSPAAPSTAPVAVEAVTVHHQIGTTAGSSEALLNDNGTTGTIFSLSAAAGVTTYRVARVHFATAPTGGAWVRGGGGNGDFDDLRVRFRSADANPDQCLDAVMLEAAFPPDTDGHPSMRRWGGVPGMAPGSVFGMGRTW